MADPQDMWRCPVSNCGYVYNPDRGDRKGKIPAGTRFEDLPDDWRCPVCGASKRDLDVSAMSCRTSVCFCTATLPPARGVYGTHQ